MANKQALEPIKPVGGTNFVRRANWLPYGRQSIDDRDVDAVCKVLKSDFLTQGPAIEAFEQKILGLVGAKYAVAFNSATSALHGAYYAAGVTAGDVVLTSPMTFAATANAALYLGAEPLFADIKINNGNIDPESVKARLTPKVKVITGIDFGGHACDVDELRAIAKQANAVFIQDSAHSLGGTYKGKQVGTLADMSIFSFHPVKTIATGEGGMVVTDNPVFAEKLRMFRTHGITKDAAKYQFANEGPWYHEMQELGYNYRMCDIQAALGTSQLDRLPQFVARRRAIAAAYRKLLSGSEWYTCLDEAADVESAYHLFPILVNKQPYAKHRKLIFEHLHSLNVGVQVHYIPVYKHPYYQNHVGNAECPVAEEFYSRVFSLPMFPAMSDDDVVYVVSALAEASRWAETHGDN